MSEETEAMKTCIEQGHDMVYDSHTVFMMAMYHNATITWVCSRCNYTHLKQATNKQLRSIKALNLNRSQRCPPKRKLKK